MRILIGMLRVMKWIEVLSSHAIASWIKTGSHKHLFMAAGLFFIF